jgi:hypothetical protein
MAAVNRGMPPAFHLALERAIELAAARQARPPPRLPFVLVFPPEPENAVPVPGALGTAVPGQVKSCLVGLGLHVEIASDTHAGEAQVDAPIAIALGAPLYAQAMEVARRGSVSNIIAENANVAHLVCELLPLATTEAQAEAEAEAGPEAGVSSRAGTGARVGGRGKTQGKGRGRGDAEADAEADAEVEAHVVADEADGARNAGATICVELVCAVGALRVDCYACRRARPDLHLGDLLGSVSRVCAVLFPGPRVDMAAPPASSKGVVFAISLTVDAVSKKLMSVCQVYIADAPSTTPRARAGSHGLAAPPGAPVVGAPEAATVECTRALLLCAVDLAQGTRRFAHLGASAHWEIVHASPL